MNVGYSRVSTSSQSLDNQIEQLKAVVFGANQVKQMNYDIILILHLLIGIHLFGHCAIEGQVVSPFIVVRPALMGWSETQVNTG